MTRAVSRSFKYVVVAKSEGRARKQSRQTLDVEVVREWASGGAAHSTALTLTPITAPRGVARCGVTQAPTDRSVQSTDCENVRCKHNQPHKEILNELFSSQTTAPLV